MPTYAVECQDCGSAYDQRLSFTQYDEVKTAKSLLPCKSCNGNAQIAFKPGSVSFVMKDGESGGWASKAMKENGYRNKHREVMAKRERDHVFKNSLQANYDGVETGKWRDAQEMARNEKGDAAASSYDSLVKQEMA